MISDRSASFATESTNSTVVLFYLRELYSISRTSSGNTRDSHIRNCTTGDGLHEYPRPV